MGMRNISLKNFIEIEQKKNVVEHLNHSIVQRHFLINFQMYSRALL